MIVYWNAIGHIKALELPDIDEDEESV